MSLVDTIERILETKISESNLKFCLVNKDKLPFRIDGELAKPNKKEDFVNIETLVNSLENIKINKYAGVGISIQASEICAIDVDHCFENPFDINSGDERANNIIEKFKNLAYIEFSFSGTGLRVLFRGDIISNYSDKYYIKNKTNSIEYYQPNDSYRYVTITGKTIIDNEITDKIKSTTALFDFLNEYMIKPIKTYYEVKTNVVENRSFEELMKVVKRFYLKDNNFQNLWFNPAPGSGKDESERDYHLVAYLYENVTQDKDLIKQIFEQSNFFKTKDYKHVNKWTYQNGRYFNYLYDTIRRLK